MPAGYIIWDKFIKKTGVNDIRFMDDKRPGKEDLYRVGAIGKAEAVCAALDLIKDEAKSRGSSVGK